MRKKIKKIEKKEQYLKNNFFDNKKVFLSILSSLLVILGSSVNVRADNNVNVNENLNIENIQSVNDSDSIIDSVIDDLYNEQMNYLVPVLEELKVFYNNQDKDDIIKTGYKTAYEASQNNLQYDKIYNGSGYSYNTKLNKIQCLKSNDLLIRKLNIKSSNSARDTDFNIIKNDSELGFQTKTNEDKQLINDYCKIIKEPFVINESLFNLIDKINNNENTNDDVIDVLNNYYNYQMNCLLKTKVKLKLFYENDKDNIIKESYPDAYKCFQKEMNAYIISNGDKNYSFIDIYLNENKNLTNSEIVNRYLELIKQNQLDISNLKIKPTGNGRDPEYGIMIDNNEEYGIRSKSAKDKELINKYSLCLDNYYYVPESLIHMIEIENNKSFNSIKIK